ncbi:MAG: helix-turn-helix domain-containing protein [Firmicutes bacterium]|nr:helix-turn-helix domain-containing protein [Bacillota bacterium]MCL2771185.1 helix-turn-helix domain-containing protein [Bacillota bacterium]
MRKLKTSNQIWEEIKISSEPARYGTEAIEKTVSIIDKVIKARLNLRLSQNDVARKIGLKQSAIARIESFRVIPKVSTLIKIAESVNVSIEALDFDEKKYRSDLENELYCYRVLNEMETERYSTFSSPQNLVSIEEIELLMSTTIKIERRLNTCK